jgi:hypothetical protein
MKAKPDKWTVVVAGSWNVRVFSPDWIGKNLTEERPISVEVSLSQPANLMRFIVGGLTIVPVEDRLIVGVQDPTIALMAKAEAVALKAVKLLPHTPIAAVGLNFGFEDEALNEKLSRLFRIADMGDLSDFDCDIKQTTIARTLTVHGETLNVNHTASHGDGRVEVHLNFHQEITSTEAATQVLQGRAKKCYDLAIRFLEHVYHCTIDEA